jgi:dCTP deaminase
MSFWSGQKLRDSLEANKFVDPFNEDAIDCAAYTLRLGDEVFTTSDDEDRDATAKGGETPGSKKLERADKVSIRAGQFAYLLTEEVVTVPHDAIAFISLKARRKLEGLINVSGFHVDPGWSSKLIFGVFNAGPSDIVLMRGEPLFLLFFADLDRNDSDHIYRESGTYQHIPPRMVQTMSGPVPSLYKVHKRTIGLKNEVATLNNKFIIATGTATLALVLAGTLFAKAVFPGLFPSPLSSDEIESIARSAAISAVSGPPIEPASPQGLPADVAEPGDTVDPQ